MTFPNQGKAIENSRLLPVEPARSLSRPTSALKSIFVGPNGLRAGWRALIFEALLVVLFVVINLVRYGGPQGFREAYQQQQMGKLAVTPLSILKGFGIAFALVCLVTLIMGRIEHRKFSEYGLPFRKALRKDFWVGWGSGFLAIGGTLLAMFLLHGYRIIGLALHGTAILSAVGAWGMAFLLTALCEEFMDRGYLQYTLATGIGFWPAAFVTSGLFAFGHIFNPNETGVGVAAVVLFGLLHCLFLRVTGNLWCAVGFHAGWDFGQTFYGVPDSGIVPYHSVFSCAFQGPRWLTGGIVGPEASVLCPIALLVVALIFTRYYRGGQLPSQR